MRTFWAIHVMTLATTALLFWTLRDIPYAWIALGCFLVWEVVSAYVVAAKYGPK